MVYIFLGNGFEEIEALTACDLLRRAGVEVALVGVNGMEILGSHGITVRADMPLEGVRADNMEMVVLPGGLRGVQSLLNCQTVLEITKWAWGAGKYVCAICAAPTILAKLGLLNDMPVTCYPGKEPEMGNARIKDAPVVRKGHLITGRAAGSSVLFALTLISALKGDEEAQRISQQIVF